MNSMLMEISQLFNLSFLDLSLNQLELKRPDFSTFVRNFSKIKCLDLSTVDISSPVPSFLANFSSLTSLRLEHCGLYGEFPIDIFQLPNLQFLYLTNNNNLTGSFPEFLAGSPLRQLSIADTNFSGHLPSSIGNLNSLNKLGVADCGFHGSLPSSLGRLLNLQFLELGGNAFSGTVDFNMFLNMKNLTILGLSDNMLSVLTRENSTTISTNATLPKFEFLFLGSCNLTSFPDFLRHQHRLKLLDLTHNHIHGKVPKWIWNTSIEGLYITDNFLTGFGVVVLPSRSIRILEFSRNNFMGALPVLPSSTTYVDGSRNEMSGEISALFFNLSSLQLLDLSYNKLSGVLPECLRNTNQNLSSLGVPQTCSFGRQLQVMDLSYNQFQGRLPQSLLSNCLELNVLKLENNHFRDVFPSWLGNLPELKLLLLRSNQFYGEITCKSTSHYEFPSLQIIDLSHNNLSGMLPSCFFQKLNVMKDFDETWSMDMF
ncbi:hypothetical protein TIFTF001_031272 [Ficus carica]|uniref:Uncharacterized protein n=1 Tax=Ficus carica TaxID=3494 RepID=A0AA88DWL7_FICCA|nr:hypothetical protein TIFTF001_031272 [Ficus carica]